MKVEFYLDFTGTFKKVIYVKLGRDAWTEFDKLTPEHIEEIFTLLCRFPGAKESLLYLSKFFPGNKRAILEQFIKCNWTVLNKPWDITDERLNFEDVQCPFKGGGNCPFQGEGLICRKTSSP